MKSVVRKVLRQICKLELPGQPDPQVIIHHKMKASVEATDRIQCMFLKKVEGWQMKLNCARCLASKGSVGYFPITLPSTSVK